LKYLKLNLIVMVLFWVFLPGLALAHGISEADKAALLSGGYIQYMWLGASHMLTGYDHLLFIFGVIFFLTGFKDIVKYITIFTVGHSLTLVFATILGITANYFLVDAVIALSVCYKGFDNLDGFKKYLKMPSPNWSDSWFWTLHTASTIAFRRHGIDSTHPFFQCRGRTGSDHGFDGYADFNWGLASNEILCTIQHRRKCRIDCRRGLLIFNANARLYTYDPSR